MRGFLFGYVDTFTGEVVIDSVVAGMIPTPAAWTQAAWFIDPVNGNDANDGTTPATAVKSYNGGVVARWGTTSPVLKQGTTITWLTSQPTPADDPVSATPVCDGGWLVLKGTPVLAYSGTITALTAKNRATPQTLLATFGAFVPTVGQLVKNTTAGKHSSATVRTVGASAELTQPQVAPTLPMSLVGTTNPPTEVDTWAIGDTIEVYTLTSVQIVNVQARLVLFNAAAGYPFLVQLSGILGIVGDGVPANANAFLNGNIAMSDVSSLSSVYRTVPSDDGGSLWQNVFLQQGFVSSCSDDFQLGFYGGCIQVDAFSVTFTGTTTLGNDVILDATLGGGAIEIGGGSATSLAQVYIKGTIFAVGLVSLAAASILWGPGSFDGIGTARITYVATAVATFLNLGGLLLNGGTSAYAVQQTDPATWHFRASGSLTPTNLDAAFPAPGAFAGLAYNVGGATFAQGTL